jgi:hypothetical protein
VGEGGGRREAGGRWKIEGGEREREREREREFPGIEATR